MSTKKKKTVPLVKIIITRRQLNSNNALRSPLTPSQKKKRTIIWKTRQKYSHLQIDILY
jgi:dihydrodipicolinate synthase/N-acetylneuraminate lyase